MKKRHQYRKANNIKQLRKVRTRVQHIVAEWNIKLADSDTPPNEGQHELRRLEPA